MPGPVAIDDGAVRIDRDQPVGIAVEGEPDVGATGDDASAREADRSPSSGR
jgi:hypothetical protein